MKAEETSVRNPWELWGEERANLRTLACLGTECEVVIGRKVVDLVESVTQGLLLKFS